MTIGRPTDYREEYCEMLIAHMEKGYSFESFGADVNCHKDTLYQWLKKHPAFADAKKSGALKSLKVWEGIGMQQALKGKGHPASWIFNMRNRFGWRNDPVDPDDSQEDYPDMVD